MEINNLLKLLNFLEESTGIEIILLFILAIVIFIGTRRIVVDKKNQYYSLNEKDRQKCQLEKDIDKSSKE